MFQLQWKVYNTVLFHPDPFRKKGSSLFNTHSLLLSSLNYSPTTFTMKPGKHKMNKYLKWLKKRCRSTACSWSIINEWTFAAFAWSPSSPPSPLQATRQRHSAGRSKLNTRPRGGRCCPSTFRCSSLMPSPLRCHTETKQVVRYARRGRRVWEGRQGK